MQEIPITEDTSLGESYAAEIVLRLILGNPDILEDVLDEMDENCYADLLLWLGQHYLHADPDFIEAQKYCEAQQADRMGL
jgi:hypothetical protein